jgi:putative transposase
LLDIAICDYQQSGNTLKLASGNNARDYMINTLKPKHPFLNTVNTRVTNNTAMRLSTSYKNFFERGNKGFPKFKSWSRNWFSLQYSEIAERGVKIDNHDVKISLGVNKKGERLYVHGKLDSKLPYSCNYKLIDMTITKKQKRFFVSIVVDFEKKREINREKNVDKWIVIDPNHKNFFVVWIMREILLNFLIQIVLSILMNQLKDCVQK